MGATVTSPKYREAQRRELAHLHGMWDAGDWTALPEAILACKVYEVPLPEWVSKAAYEAVLKLYLGPTHGKEGAYGSTRGRLRMDYAHFLRWSALNKVLESHELTELPANRGRPRKEAMTRSALLDEALKVLEGHNRSSSTKQIAESFDLVGKSLSSGETRFQFLQRLVAFKIGSQRL